MNHCLDQAVSPTVSEFLKAKLSPVLLMCILRFCLPCLHKLSQNLISCIVCSSFYFSTLTRWRRRKVTLKLCCTVESLIFWCWRPDWTHLPVLPHRETQNVKNFQVYHQEVSVKTTFWETVLPSGSSSRLMSSSWQMVENASVRRCSSRQR